MATTVVMPPANTIGLASKYLPVLDEVYKRGSLTSIFDTAENRVNWIGAKTVSLFDFDPVGMANYDRDDGFVTGNITAGWKPYQIEVDRGRSYQIDVRLAA